MGNKVRNINIVYKVDVFNSDTEKEIILSRQLFEESYDCEIKVDLSEIESYTMCNKRRHCQRGSVKVILVRVDNFPKIT